MADVHTKIRDYYQKGRRDAIDDMEYWLRLVAERFGDIKLDTGHDLSQFMDLITRHMREHMLGEKTE